MEQSTKIKELIRQKTELIRKIDDYSYSSVDERDNDMLKLDELEKTIYKHSKEVVAGFSVDDIPDEKMPTPQELVPEEIIEEPQAPNIPPKNLNYRNARALVKEKREGYRLEAKEFLKKYQELVKKKQEGVELLDLLKGGSQIEFIPKELEEKIIGY